MKAAELKALLSEENANFEQITTKLIVRDSDREAKIEKWIKLYDGEHDIMERPDKTVGSGENKKQVEVNRLVVKLQKKIVESAVAFLLGGEFNLRLVDNDEKSKEAFKAFKKQWDGAKLYYHTKRLARRLFIETQVAELFYVHPDTKKIKVMLLCKENKDSIYPVFDEYGDMIAFIRDYQVTNNGQTVIYRDLYMDEVIYHGVKSSSGYTLTSEKNLFGKIPVIYFTQGQAEWEDVQTEIDRIELLLSKNADTNDYFGSPAVKMKGNVVNAPSKEEVGKIFRLQPITNEGKTEYGDIEYLTWDNSSEGFKTEYDILKEIAYSLTATPDLSFNNLKGVGQVTGPVLQFMFLDSILKAKAKEETFGEMIERRINLLLAMMATINNTNETLYKNMKIEFDFGNPLPNNIAEVIQMLSQAVGGEPVMSRQTAVKLNPLVDDADAENEQITKESEALQPLNESFA